MKNFIKKLFLLSVPAGLVLIAILLGPYDKKFAYAYLKGDYEEASSIYKRIFERQQPIDVAFIGTSHTLNGVNDSLLENTLSAKLGRDVKVANLALSHFGANVHYAIFKDLLKTKKPKLLVYEVREVEARFSHFAFPIIADTEDVLLPEAFMNTYLFRDYIYALQSRYAYLKTMSAKQPVTLAAKANLNYGYSPINHIAPYDELLMYRQQELQKPMFYLGEDLKNIEFSHSKSYVQKIYEIARENDVEIVFLYLPSYKSPVNKPVEYEFYNQMGHVWMPPSQILNDSTAWADINHLNHRGATALSGWLVKELEKNNALQGSRLGAIEKK
ncbi:hypothetical protein ABID22_004004 [Pontibacter aydingkolensis]|uniref:DUF1574 domain-containing protein n=1 Tax=Pontibacter aydingkolensis TaxID=1911536 RepID=A0ABS7CZI7_9BACT|nr:hypothetical protein [Pontibacter aydingkolensis]MBW7469249.1 hypothetical protein [Pontibacter aydingkolensis]